MKQFKVLASIALSAAVMAGGGSVAFAQAGDDGEALSLAPVAAAAQSPRLRSLSNASTVSWLESQPDGQFGIRLMTLKDGRLPREALLPKGRLLANGLIADGGEYDLALNPVSTLPAVVWAREADGGTTLRFSDKPDESQVIYESPGVLELPSLTFDDEGHAYAAWSEISGGISRVYAAHQADGAWRWTVLSEGERPYDVLPQLFSGNDGAELYWYAIDESAVLARMVALNAEQISDSPVFSLGAIPANRLPILYRCTGEDLLGAIWLEQRETGEAYLDMDPRDENGPRQLGDPGATVQSLSISEDATATKAIIETDAAGERHLIVGNPFTGRTIRREVSRSASDPTVSISENWVNVAWIDEDAAAPGSVIFWRFH